MKTKHIFTALVASMLFIACSSSDDLKNEQVTALQFSGSYDASVAPQEIDPWGYELLEDSLEGTLSKVNKFMLDDEARTRAPQDNTWANMSDRDLSVMVGSNVYKYSVAANGAITSSTPYYFTTTSDIGVSAWYPYSASLDSFSVQTDQSTAANYEKSCLLYATQTVNQSGTTNSLTFSHKTAKLILTVNFTGVRYVLSSTVNSLKINGAKITGTVSDGSITGTKGNATQITAYCSRASSTTGDVTTAIFECSIIPQTAELTLSIDDGGAIYRGTIPSRAYAANTIYTATVNMDATPKAIDLGLSVKWADRNLGAHYPADFGAYYQWGATTEYANTNQYWGTTTENITVASGHDIARIKWGGNWRMPTESEMRELYSLVWTDSIEVIDEETSKYLAACLSRSGYSEKLFLPYAGRAKGMEYIYSSGYYWTSTGGNGNTVSIHIWGGPAKSIGTGYTRNDGLSVRAVCD